MKKTLLAWLLILASLTTFAADKPISGLTIYNGAPGTNDLVPFVNRADVTQSTNGSTRSMTWSNLNQFIRPNFTANNFNSTQFGLNGSTNVYIKSGSDQTNVLMFPSIAGNSSAAFYDTNFTVKASFDYLGNFSSSGNNTFTGTNNFTGAVIITNAGSTISGDGAGLTNLSLQNNGIGLRVIGQSPTNIVWPTVYWSYVTNSVGTNNGGWGTNCDAVLNINCLPLTSTNSRVLISWSYGQTNQNSAAVACYFVGATNWLGNSSLSGNTTSPYYMQAFVNFIPVMQNAGSYTNQYRTTLLTSGVFGNPTLLNTAVNLVDTSTNWNFMLGLQNPYNAGQGALTNYLIYPVVIYEEIIP